MRSRWLGWSEGTHRASPLRKAKSARAPTPSSWRSAARAGPRLGPTARGCRCWPVRGRPGRAARTGQLWLRRRPNRGRPQGRRLERFPAHALGRPADQAGRAGARRIGLCAAGRVRAHRDRHRGQPRVCRVGCDPRRDRRPWAGDRPPRPAAGARRGDGAARGDPSARRAVARDAPEEPAVHCPASRRRCCTSYWPEQRHDPRRAGGCAQRRCRSRWRGRAPSREAISTAGGVPFEALTTQFMLRDLPGVFCAGEMLDWEAPTGGYLLTACFATGARRARARRPGCRPGR